MRIYFYGATGMVTGSNFLLEVGSKKILIDCGLYQSTHFCDEKNFSPFPYNPADIFAVFITHAHLDHTGRLPKLAREGFTGKIYSTLPTRDFAEPLLFDSEHVLRQESERAGLPPVYSADDVFKALSLWEGVPYHKKLDFGDFSIIFYDAGHILGSSSVVVESGGKKIVFSGDLGNTPSPIIRPTEYVSGVEHCVIESTYGGRVHEDGGKRKDKLKAVIAETVKAGGVLMIPAFAMERTQELLYELNQFIEHKEIPPVPVFIDSPLAIKLTAVYEKYENYFNKETANLIKSGDDIFNFRGLHMTLSAEQSKEINNVPAPKIIIAGSGMSQGGRILHHEYRYLSDPKNAILFVGFQAVGSLGRRILDGEKTVRIFGEEIEVRAKVRAIGSYSAHADQPRLLSWLSHIGPSLRQVFLVHGEPEEAGALKKVAESKLGARVVIPAADSVYDII